MDDDEAIPALPIISEDDLRYGQETGDYVPVFFEWYKFVGLLANYCARIRQDSPALKPIEPQHFHLLIGLLNRCARLMHSNVALSHQRLFGETTAIIDRCIFESALTVRWICSGSIQERAKQFTANGLKTEIEFKKHIESNINDRSGQTWAIEKRMLRSIDNQIEAAKLSAEEIISSKKMPDMASMLESLGHSRLAYVIWQRIGSHHIHGTWPSLLVHYLEEVQAGVFGPRDHDCETHVNQFVNTSLIVLEAVDSFVRCVVSNGEDMAQLIDRCDDATKRIVALFNDISKADQ